MIPLLQTDSTTFLAPCHRAEIDHVANILIWPDVSERIPQSITPDVSSTFDPIVVQLVEGTGSIESLVLP
jgi:5-oxoprolinase (ATP-hydrolysing)